jgi:hypothetical protein
VKPVGEFDQLPFVVVTVEPVVVEPLTTGAAVFDGGVAGVPGVKVLVALPHTSKPPDLDATTPPEEANP